MSTRRVQKVSELLAQQISILILENIPEDLGLVTVTAVNTNADLKDASVFVSCLDKSSNQAVLKLLLDKAKEFQHVLGRRLSMKFTPRLHFLLDESQEEVNRVEELLEKI